MGSTFEQDIDRMVQARLDFYRISRWAAFALGALVTSVALLVVFIYTAKQTPHCEDGHVGFRIEQCLSNLPGGR